MLTMKSKKADIYAAYMALVQEPAAPKPQGIEKLMSQVASHKKGVTQTGRIWAQITTTRGRVIYTIWDRQTELPFIRIKEGRPIKDDNEKKAILAVLKELHKV